MRKVNLYITSFIVFLTVSINLYSMEDFKRDFKHFHSLDYIKLVASELFTPRAAGVGLATLIAVKAPHLICSALESNSDDKKNQEDTQNRAWCWLFAPSMVMLTQVGQWPQTELMNVVKPLGVALASLSTISLATYAAAQGFFYLDRKNTYSNTFTRSHKESLNLSLRLTRDLLSPLMTGVLAYCAYQRMK